MESENFIKTIYAENSNLNDTIFTIQVSERYLEKYDEFKDLESGIEFIVVERPYQTLEGKWELKCKILTKINALRYLRNRTPYPY